MTADRCQPVVHTLGTALCDVTFRTSCGPLLLTKRKNRNLTAMFRRPLASDCEVQPVDRPVGLAGQRYCVAVMIPPRMNPSPSSRYQFDVAFGSRPT